MRPVSLTIDGFTSYGEPTELYLEPLQLTAITGRNGAGKTSVVDAMIFALFGRGRVDGDINAVVTTGVDKATVAFAFELNGRLWRITRIRHATKNRTAVSLECQDEEGVWQARSNGTVKDTDEAVREVLGMSLDTFLATVIIGQGDADRFCAADPVVRKEILGEVLRLGVYQRYAERARQTLADKRASVATTSQRIDALAAEIASLDSAPAEKAAAEGRRTCLQAELDQCEAALTEATAAERAAASAAEEVAAAEDRLARLREAAATRLAEMRRQASEAAIRRDRQASRVAEGRSQVTAAKAAAGRAASLRATAAAAAERAVAAGQTEERLVSEGQQAREAEAGLQARLTALSTQRSEAEERLDGLRRATAPGSSAEARAACWVCTQPLTPEHALRMLDELTDEIARLTSAERETIAAHDQATAQLARLRADYRSAKSERETAATEASGAQVSAERAAAEGDMLASLSARLRDAEADLADATQLAGSLAEALTRADQPDPEVVATEADLARFRERHAATEGLRAQRVKVEGDKARLSTELAEASRVVGVLTERVSTLDRLRAEHRMHTAALVPLREAEQDWGRLTQAFGRDGVPALIVASEVAELEEQTNLLLADLSSHTLAIRLTTTRVNKSGTVKDTLDITVVGPDGERPYDSYSGGERLRVDIAIRLGLSQMLANRSGTSIKMLIIDEGWGPLDSDGIPALIDCLRILQESGRFESVYTITHLPEVASAFPQQISVDRGPDGYSVVEVAA